MKKHDFSNPTRQASITIIVIIWTYLKLVFRVLWPILLIFIFRQKSNVFNYIIPAIILILLIAFVFAIIAFYKHVFYVKDEHLHVEKGIFNRVTLNIPFDRIQSVNFEQDLLFQLTDHVKVNIDTAGSKKQEFSLKALSSSDADALKQIIFKNQQNEQFLQQSESNHEISVPKESLNEHIVHLKLEDLLLIGLTENHLKAGIWLLGLVYYFYERIKEVGYDLVNYIPEETSLQNTFNEIPYIVGALIIGIVILVLISVVRTFLMYFDLQVNRIYNGFMIHKGLLNKTTFLANDRKVQRIYWTDNIISRLLSIRKLTFHQVSHSEKNQSKKATIPLRGKDKLDRIIQYIFPQFNSDYTQTYTVSKYYFIRRLYYIIPLYIILIIQSLTTDLIDINPLIQIILYSFFIVLIVWLIWKRMHTFKIAINDQYLYFERGVFDFEYDLLPLYKIQSVELKQSYYKKRKEVANIIFITASGDIEVPYLNLKDAYYLRNLALYKAEISNIKWM